MIYMLCFSAAGHRFIPYPGVGLYGASKHAITAICDSIRYELTQQKSKTRITVN